MTFVDHQIYNFYKINNGLVLGDSSSNIHNGIKDEYVSTIEHLIIPSHVGIYKVIMTGYRCLRDLPNVQTAFIPKTITFMDGDTFVNCYKLHTVTFEENSALKTMNQYIFYQTNLTTITFPPSVKNISYSSFYNNKYMKSIVIPGFLYTSYANVFEGVPENILILVPKNYPFDEFGGRNVTKILPEYTGKPQMCTQPKCRRISSNIAASIIVLLTHM